MIDNWRTTTQYYQQKAQLCLIHFSEASLQIKFKTHEIIQFPHWQKWTELSYLHYMACNCKEIYSLITLIWYIITLHLLHLKQACSLDQVLRFPNWLVKALYSLVQCFILCKALSELLFSGSVKVLYSNNKKIVLMYII